MRSRQRGQLGWLSSTLLHALLIAVGVTMLAPFAWMLLTSFKSEGEVFQQHLVPRVVTLGADGAPVLMRDGQQLFTVPGGTTATLTARSATAASASARVYPPGSLLRVRLGTPRMDGSRSDQPRLSDGSALLDDQGVPVLNGMIEGKSGVVRFRDPRVRSKFAEPVLIPRDLLGEANEQLAKRYYARYTAHWDAMVAARWNGLVPLMLTDALNDTLAAQARSATALRIAGRVVMMPGSEVAYQSNTITWNRSGEPVRYPRRATTVVDDRGQPIRYIATEPVYAGDDAYLQDAAGRDLLVRIGSATATPTKVRGADLAVEQSIRFVVGNYQTVLSDPEIKISLFAWNSFFVCACTVLLKLLTSSLAAFAFARMQWRGRDAVFVCYLGTLMIPGIVTAIPNYLILQHLGWLNSFAALIIPGAATAYGTFMLRQYMLTLPAGLEEAARIDGASWLRVWWDICVPMTKPALITLAIFTFAATWQSFSWPLIVAKEESVRVLPVALYMFEQSSQNAYHLLMASSVILMIPTLILFLVGQRYFVSGMTIGAVKG